MKLRRAAIVAKSGGDDQSLRAVVLLSFVAILLHELPRRRGERSGPRNKP